MGVLVVGSSPIARRFSICVLASDFGIGVSPYGVIDVTICFLIGF